MSTRVARRAVKPSGRRAGDPIAGANYLPFFGYYPLDPWAGFAVLCGWAAAALGLAAFLLHRRDA